MYKIYQAHKKLNTQNINSLNKNLNIEINGVLKYVMVNMVWRQRKGNSSFTVGVQNNGATVEISVEGPQIDLPKEPSILFLDLFPKGSMSYYRGTWSFIFIAALLAIAKK